MGLLGPERVRQDDDPAHPHRLSARRRRAPPASPASTSCATPWPSSRASATCPRTRRSTTGCACANSSRSWPGSRASRGAARAAAVEAPGRAPRTRATSALLIGTLSQGIPPARRHRPGPPRPSGRCSSSTSPPMGSIPRQIIEMRGLIRALAGELTILVTSHILAEMERVADRVAILARGPAARRSARSGAGDAAVHLRLRVRGDEAPCAPASPGCRASAARRASERRPGAASRPTSSRSTAPRSPSRWPRPSVARRLRPARPRARTRSISRRSSSSSRAARHGESPAA